MKISSIFFLLVVNVVLAVITIVAAIAGWRSFELIFEGERAKGQVIALIQTTDSEGDCCLYIPVVRYTIADRTLEIEGNTASSPPGYTVGEEVEVVYDPQNYSKAAINKFSELWLMPTILGGIVAILFVTLNAVSIAALFASRRSNE